MTKILVVDDSPIDRAAASGFLQEAGFTPLHAEDGSGALAVVATDGPEIVLTDLQMPGMDGLELVRTMRERHPTVPVILMTAHGSEEIAVAALHAGAAHYVPKSSLHVHLTGAVKMVRDAARASVGREQVRAFLQHQESYYQLGYDRAGPRALIGHLQHGLQQMQLCKESDLIRIGTALTEALANAIDHGNLELDSALRAESIGAYLALGRERSLVSPYRERRVHVTVRVTPDAATFVVRDEGPGFDVDSLPDPRDPENLNKPSGRGVLLIRTFMDEVRFNAKGNEITMVLRQKSGAA